MLISGVNHNYMALSRIWAAFILIAIGLAALKYSFSASYKTIFTEMVAGKAGDTIRLAVPAAAMPSPAAMLSTRGE